MASFQFSMKNHRFNFWINVFFICLNSHCRIEVLKSRVALPHHINKFISLPNYSALEPANGGALQEKVLLETFQNSQENTCARASILVNLQVDACNFIRKRLWHRCFSLNFLKFLRTPFLLNICGRPLLQLWTLLNTHYFSAVIMPPPISQKLPIMKFSAMTFVKPL